MGGSAVADEADPTAAIAARIAARYGHPGRCEPTTRAGWEGFPLLHCRYGFRELTAEVVVVDTGPERIARWIVGTCRELAAPHLADCAERLRQHVERVSFYSFPVAGIVLEDLYPDVPGVEGYAFRDGVTVRVEGYENGRSAQPTRAEVDAALDGPVRDAMRYARLQSTSREDYRAGGGAEDVGTSAAGARKVAWLDVVRTLYQAAWGSEHNELMVAWARAHRKLLGLPDPAAPTPASP